MRLKKTRLFYLAVAVIFTMVQMVPAMAEETQEFVIDEDGVLTAYNGEDTVVEIPDTVKKIGDKAFEKKGKILGVVMPDSVTSIGDGAFDSCSSLKDVAMSKGLKEIGESAFKNCKQLVYIDFPGELETIGNKAFYSTGLRFAKLPDSVKTIGKSAFYNSKLESIHLNEGLTTIGESAFETCYNLQGLRVPASVTEVGSSGAADNGSPFKWILFENDGVKLPSYLTDQMDITYYGGDPSTVKTLYDEIYKKNNKTKLKFKNKSEFISFTDFTPTESTKTIHAGEDHKIILNLAPGSTTPMVINFISMNPKVAEVDKDGLVKGKKVGTAEILIFTADNNLAKVNINVEAKEGQLFEITPEGVLTDYYGHDINVTLPDEVKVISDEAFKGNKNLKSLTLGKNVVKIADNAFEGCINLESVNYGNEIKLEEIGKKAFKNCKSLKLIEFPLSLRKIGEEGFYNCEALATVKVADDSKLTILPKAVFSGCKALKSFKIPEDCEELGENAFSGNLQLEKIEFNSKLKKIGAGVFRKCDGIQTLSIPKGVTDIGKGAFLNMGKLETLNLPDTFVNVNAVSIVFLFDMEHSENKSSLQQINIDKNNPKFSSYEGCIYEEKILRYIPSGRITAKIKSDTVEIGDAASNAHMNLERIVIPNSVKKIGESAFQNCFGLKSITLPDGIEEVGKAAFLGCEELEDIRIPRGVKKIGSLAFYELEQVKELIVPDGVTKIEPYAVAGNDNMEHLTLSRNITEIANNGCSFCPSLKELYLPEKLKSIGDQGFGKCDSLTHLELPFSLENVNKEAFSYCQSLKSVYIPSNVNLADNVFMGVKPEQKIFVFTHEGNPGIKKLADNPSFKLIDLEYEKRDLERKVEVQKLENLLTDSNLNSKFKLEVKEEKAEKEKDEIVKLSLKAEENGNQLKAPKQPLRLIVELKPEEEEMNFEAFLVKEGKKTSLNTGRIHRFLKIDLTGFGTVVLSKKKTTPLPTPGPNPGPSPAPKPDDKDKIEKKVIKGGRNKKTVISKEIQEKIKEGLIEKLQMKTGQVVIEVKGKQLADFFSEENNNSYYKVEVKSLNKRKLPKRLRRSTVGKKMYNIILVVSGKKIRKIGKGKIKISLPCDSDKDKKKYRYFALNLKTGKLIKGKLTDKNKMTFKTSLLDQYTVIKK